MDLDRLPAARVRYGALVIPLFPGQSLRIGRAPGNDVVINDARVSRMHAGLEWNGSGFTLRDLDSANGTFVNSQRLAESARLLRDGDEITLGAQTLVYEIARADASELPAETAAVENGATLAARGPRLVVTAGPDKGQQYVLWGETIIIGRASREATWEIRLTDREVSRPHACLRRRGAQYTLVDLESANGTRLNGAPLKRSAVLKAGDEIAIGGTCLIFYP